MDQESGAASYSVNCFHCKASFDAAQSEWCRCVAATRSLVCPNCQRCFCQAPAAYKSDFWRRAPQELWKEKLARWTDAALPENPGDPDSVKRPLVLVADDERVIQRMAGAAVEGLGYGLLIARDGQEALDLARRFKPELVLSDILMPKLDGRELCKRIKTDEALRATAVVLITSVYKSSKYKLEAINVFRADEYLLKPLDIGTLRMVLQRFLK